MASATHRACCQLAPTPETSAAWVTTRRPRFHGHPVALCRERHNGPLGFAWRQDAWLLRVPLTPLPWAQSRAACPPAGPQPPSPTLRARAQLVEPRRRVVGEKVRMTNRLTRTLHTSCPQVRPWLQEQDPPLWCACLRRWPPLRAVHRARRSPLARCFRAHPVRSPEVIARRLQDMRAALPLPPDDGGIAPHTRLGQARVAPRRVPVQALAASDVASAQQAQRPPAGPLCPALPGAGPVVAPRLLVACGEQRARSAAAALQKYAGMAPVTARSGKKAWVHWRLQCPKVLRQTVVAWAAESIRHAFWAQVYYQQQRAKGKTHQAAVRALACTWLRILSRCWQERTPYDEAIYLQALHRRGASRCQTLAKAS